MEMQVPRENKQLRFTARKVSSPTLSSVPSLVRTQYDGNRGSYEHDLDGGARQKSWHLSAADGHFLAGGADVGRKEAQKQKA